MNHPSKEDLISLLYKEVSRERESELNTHLQSCAACRTQLSAWQNVQVDLGRSRVPAHAKRPLVPVSSFKWAAVAVIMLTIGFAWGRFNLTQGDAGKLRAQLQTELRDDLNLQLKASHEADRKEFIAMLRDVEEQRLSEYRQLRKDLETVAVVADEKLSTTQRALNQLNLVAQSDSNNR
ncbi:MAG: hypothetical protein JWM68_5037 [Verrucomicrobiales bacterium]|nr:hypothetical protein [Verrucomicrobiales bacterium]